MLADIDCVTERGDLLRRMAGGGAALIAGGTDFVPLYAAGAIAAGVALDVTAVPELVRIDHGDDAVGIGAAVRLVDVGKLRPLFLRAVADGAGLIGSRQTRARATLGGNICRASPSGDTLPGILTTEAAMVLISVQGERRVAAADFFVGPGRTVRRPDEVLERIEIPVRSDTVSAYLRSTVRNAMDLATVGIAVSVELTDSVAGDVRVAVGGAGPRPLLIDGVAELMAGRALSELASAVPQLDSLVQEQISPIDDSRGSAWYRRQLIGPLLYKVFSRVQTRAQEDR